MKKTGSRNETRCDSKHFTTHLLILRIFADGFLLVRVDNQQIGVIEMIGFVYMKLSGIGPVMKILIILQITGHRQIRDRIILLLCVIQQAKSVVLRIYVGRHDSLITMIPKKFFIRRKTFHCDLLPPALGTIQRIIPCLNLHLAGIRNDNFPCLNGRLTPPYNVTANRAADRNHDKYCKHSKSGNHRPAIVPCFR